MTDVLVITTKYSEHENNPYLTNDLVEILKKDCLNISIINIDWQHKKSEFLIKSIKSKKHHLLQISLPEYKVLGVFKLPFRWICATFVVAYTSIKFKKINSKIIITFSPCIHGFLTVFLAKLIYRSKAKHVIWDFFPLHHTELKLIPIYLTGILKFVEESFMRIADNIICINENYSEFLKNNYKVNKCKILNLQLWGNNLKTSEISNVLKKIVIKDNSINMIYGGQLVEGRDLDFIIKFSKKMENNSKNFRLIIIGSGKNFHDIEKLIYQLEITNVILLQQLQRDVYLNLLAHCHIGYIALDDRINSPSFPSKIIDYTKAGLAVIYQGPSTGGMQKFIEENQIGVNILSSYDENLKEEIILNFVSNSVEIEICKKNSLKCYGNNFDINNCNVVANVSRVFLK